MKRNKSCILFLLGFCMLLAGCGKADRPADAEMPAGYNITEAQTYYYSSRLADNGEGVYFCLPAYSGVMLYYYDLSGATQTAVPLCSRADCSHNSSECDAYLEDREVLDYCLWAQGDRLYRMERDADTNVVYLTSSEFDGSDVTRCAKLWEGDMWYSANLITRRHVMHRGFFYYTVCEEYGSDCMVNRVDLATGEVVNVGIIPAEYEGAKGGMFHVGVYGDRIYYSMLYSSSYEAEDAEYYCVLYCYDKQAEEFMELHVEHGGFDSYYVDDRLEGEGFEGLDMRAFAFDEEGDMYIWSYLNGSFRRVDMETWESEELFCTEDYGRVVYDGENFVLNNKDSSATVDYKRFVLYNPKTGELRECVTGDRDSDRGYFYLGGDKTFNFALTMPYSSKDAGTVSDIVLYDKSTLEERTIITVDSRVFSALTSGQEYVFWDTSDVYIGEKPEEKETEEKSRLTATTLPFPYDIMEDEEVTVITDPEQFEIWDIEPYDNDSDYNTIKEYEQFGYACCEIQHPDEDVRDTALFRYYEETKEYPHIVACRYKKDGTGKYQSAGEIWVYSEKGTAMIPIPGIEFHGNQTDPEKTEYIFVIVYGDGNEPGYDYVVIDYSRMEILSEGDSIGNMEISKIRLAYIVDLNAMEYTVYDGPFSDWQSMMNKKQSEGNGGRR